MLGNDIRSQAHACESKVDNPLCVWNGDSNSSSLFNARTTSNGKPLRGQQLRAELELHNNATQTILHADPSDELTSKSLLKSFATGQYLLCYQRERRLRKKRGRRKTLNQAENARTRRYLSPNYGATIFPSSGDTLDGQPSITLNTSCPTFTIHTEESDEKPAKILTNPDFADYSPGSSQGLRKLHSSFPNDNDAFLELNQVSISSPYIGNISNLSNKDISCPIDLNKKKPTGSRPILHPSIRKLKMYAKGSSSPQGSQKKKIEENNCKYSNDLYRSRLSMLASAASSTSDMRLQVSYYSRDSLQSLRWSDAEVRNSKTTALSHEDISNVTVPISLSISIMTTYILIGAIVFCIWEDDNYLKWSYFCFVTLSTIGFGDIVPGTKVDSTNPQEKLIIISLYVAIGLSVFAMCFKLMQEEVVSKCKWLGHKIGLLKHRVKKQKFSLPQPRDNVTPTHV
ncbi:unnamed protein product [Dibothriocephalus latus]|uniref:Potassium channel domain-containing protein n=1 Tax=Dibothriocephalus latus TaxID=60516 RepID=A0A3P7LSA7_DIBLA|nr:unnamed protein product [Dibothriocephalus latus]